MSVELLLWLQPVSFLSVWWHYCWVWLPCNELGLNKYVPVVLFLHSLCSFFPSTCCLYCNDSCSLILFVVFLLLVVLIRSIPDGFREGLTGVFIFLASLILTDKSIISIAFVRGCFSTSSNRDHLIYCLWSYELTPTYGYAESGFF